MPAAAKPQIADAVMLSASTPSKIDMPATMELPKMKEHVDADVQTERRLSESGILNPATLPHLSTPESSEIFPAAAAPAHRAVLDAAAVNPMVATPIQGLSGTHTFDPSLYITSTGSSREHVETIEFKTIDLSWLIQLQKDLQSIKGDNEGAINNLEVRNKLLEIKKNAVPDEYRKELHEAQTEVSKHERLYNNHPQISRKLLAQKAQLQQNIENHSDEVKEIFSALKTSFNGYLDDLQHDMGVVTKSINESTTRRFEHDQELNLTNLTIKYLDQEQKLRELVDAFKKGDINVSDQIAEQETHLQELKQRFLSTPNTREDYFDVLNSIQFYQNKQANLENDLTEIETTLGRLEANQKRKEAIYRHFQDKLRSALQSEESIDTTVSKLTDLLPLVKKFFVNGHLSKSIGSIKEKFQTLDKVKAELQQIDCDIPSKQQQLNQERLDLEKELTAAEATKTLVQQQQNAAIDAFQDDIDKNMLLMARHQNKINNLDQFNATCTSIYEKINIEMAHASELTEKHKVYSANSKAIRSYFEYNGLLYGDNESAQIWQKYNKNIYDYSVKTEGVVKIESVSEDQDTRDLLDQVIATGHTTVSSNNTGSSLAEELTQAIRR